MTTRELYRNVLIELNKEEASALYVEDFLYYANKAVNWYVNMRYNLFEVSQQLSDDLRVLKAGPEKLAFPGEDPTACKAKCVESDCATECAGSTDTECVAKCEAIQTACKNKCEAENLLRLDHEYRHLLNCIVTTKLDKFTFGCDQEANTEKEYAARRLTSDRKAAITNNTYLEPRFYRPYFDIIGNTLYIRAGDPALDKFTITKVTIEYLRDPKKIHLEAGDLITEADTTEALEFSEYVCTELVNMTTSFVLEQGSNPRMATVTQVNQSIGGNTA